MHLAFYEILLQAQNNYKEKFRRTRNAGHASTFLEKAPTSELSRKSNRYDQA